MINGSYENIEKRLRSYRTVLEANAQAHKELSKVTRDGERPIENARSKAYEDSLGMLDRIFPLLTKDKPKK